MFGLSSERITLYISDGMSYLNMQSYTRKVLCIQRDLRYGDLGSHCMLKMESGNYLIMM
jgi:hypothetical protein